MPKNAKKVQIQKVAIFDSDRKKSKKDTHRQLKLSLKYIIYIYNN